MRIRSTLLRNGAYRGVRTCEVFLCFVAIVRVRVLTLLRNGAYLGVRSCEVFLCFVAIVSVRVLTSLFSLFYITGECYRFFHRGVQK